MDVTRRSLSRITAGMVAVAAGIQRGVSQTDQPRNVDLESARDLLRANARQLANVKLPMATEPAFHFKA